MGSPNVPQTDDDHRSPTDLRTRVPLRCGQTFLAHSLVCILTPPPPSPRLSDFGVEKSVSTASLSSAADVEKSFVDLINHAKNLPRSDESKAAGKIQA